MKEDRSIINPTLRVTQVGGFSEDAGGGGTEPFLNEFYPGLLDPAKKTLHFGVDCLTIRPNYKGISQLRLVIVELALIGIERI